MRYLVLLFLLLSTSLYADYISPVKPIKYITITSLNCETYEEFDELVNNKIKHGWVPLGNACLIRDNNVIQTMVLYPKVSPTPTATPSSLTSTCK